MTPLSRLFRHCAQGALFLCLTSCSAHPDAVRIIMRGESVTLSAPGITIHLDGAMHLAVQRSIDGQARPLARPAATHYVMVNGTVIDIFNREPGQPDESDAVTTFGNTHHVTFVGINTTPGGSPLQKFHTFLFPSRYPGLVLNQVSYRNLGTADILIENWYAEHYSLDAGQEEESQSPAHYWTFQGGMLQGETPSFAFPLAAGFTRSHTTSSAPQGIPMVDIWGRHAGLAIGLVDTAIVDAVIVTASETAGSAIVDIQHSVMQVLRSGETLRIPTTYTFLHDGDYYRALDNYTALLADQSVILTPTPEALYAQQLGPAALAQLHDGAFHHLYTLGFDRPDYHMVTSDSVVYYVLSTDAWSGPVELRGLESRGYQVRNRDTGADLGSIHGPLGRLIVHFEGVLRLAVTAE